MNLLELNPRSSRTPNVLRAMMLTLFLSGCGGGGASDPADTRQPIVTAIEAAAVWYGEPATIRVTGERLDENLRIRLSGACNGEPTPISSSDSLIEIRCTPDALGLLRAAVIHSTGSELSTRDWTIEAPIVELEMGLAESPISVRVELEPGPVDSIKRSWVDLFLYRLREGEYSGTVFHQILGGTRLEGGCYVMRGDPPFPGAGTWSVSPVAVEQRLVEPNAQYTIAMSAARCEGASGTMEPGIFAINLADNAGSSLTTVDDRDYVVIGRLAGNAAQTALGQFSNQAVLPSAPSPAWPMPFPSLPEAAVLRSIRRLR